MSRVRRASYFAAYFALASSACSAEMRPAASPSRANGSSNDSLICKAVTDRMVGIAGLDAGTPATQVKALAGRWWIRSCSTKRVGTGIRVQLGGPGWYFVDQRDDDFALREQVGFTLGIELEGKLELKLAERVASLWFEPTKLPEIELQVARDLGVHPTSVWGSLVSMVPLVSVRDRVAERLSTVAESALRTELHDGATATFDFASGQRDVTLGKLPPGHTPRTAFPGSIPWLVNDRLFLPPNATQAVGPFDPGPIRLDVHIEQGDGIAYRAICQRDMAADYEVIASGDLRRLAEQPLAARGALEGVGEHSALLRVDDCRFFVVLSTVDDSTTVAAVRVRG